MYAVHKFQDQILWVTASDGGIGNKYNVPFHVPFLNSLVHQSKIGIRLWHTVQWCKISHDRLVIDDLGGMDLWERDGNAHNKLYLKLTNLRYLS